jgi:Protein of unknown function (DUF2591)
MKTSELSGPALDWAVATAMGLRVEYDYQYTEEKFFQGWWQCGPCHWQPLPKYSSDWAHGGPIIERADISLYSSKAPEIGGRLWVAFAKGINAEGPTPLIAAMRCYVASKLGEEIEVPEELNGIC